MRRIAAIGVAVALLMIAGATGAAAAPQPALARPTECLAAFDDVDNDYVGDGWVGTLVASHTGDWWTDLWDSTDRAYSLFCGDELSGVVHTAHEEGTGHGHAVDAVDEDEFVHCWRATIGNGDPVPDPKSPNRLRFVMKFAPDEHAIAIVDRDRKFTYTLYTEGAISNNWHDCYVRLS
jgi:hypothetical protein